MCCWNRLCNFGGCKSPPMGFKGPFWTKHPPIWLPCITWDGTWWPKWSLLASHERKLVTEKFVALGFFLIAMRKLSYGKGKIIISHNTVMLKEGLIFLYLSSASLVKNNMFFLYMKNRRKQKLLFVLSFFQSSYTKSRFPNLQNLFQVFKERISDLWAGTAKVL